MDNLKARRRVIGKDIINAIRRNAGPSPVTARTRPASASLIWDRKGLWEKELAPSAESRLVNAVDDCVNKALGHDTGLGVRISAVRAEATYTHLVDRLQGEWGRDALCSLVDPDRCGQSPDEHVRNRIHQHKPSQLGESQRGFW